MPLTPEQIRSKSFPTVHGRGYDRSEVADFLKQVASDYGALIKAKSEMDDGAPSDEQVGAQIREVLQAAFESAARIREKAQQEAEQLVAEAERRANELRDQVERTQAEADERTTRGVQTTIADANERVREIKERAEREAADLVAEAHKRFETMAAHQQLLRERIGRIDDLVEKLKEEVEPLASEGVTEQAGPGEEASHAY